MSPFLSDQVKATLLAQQLSRAPWLGAVMGLIQAPVAYGHGLTLAPVLAVELVCPGYARQALTTWSAPTLTTSFLVASAAAPITFHNTGPSLSSLIWGFFFLDVIGNRLITAGPYAPPKVIPAFGIYTTTPFVTLTGNP